MGFFCFFFSLGFDSRLDLAEVLHCLKEGHARFTPSEMNQKLKGSFRGETIPYLITPTVFTAAVEWGTVCYSLRE